ncbi:DUF1570 domain-containing protein [Spartinivicinus ruber]|uniref:DUF1570 domain-containing protein n=1 Tax=Spartinivicinus ruber TaxID=2683272 RepID=UPI0013D6BBA7|nr:DUF1570 domain-containing protein [Spartinivicinus ruber]
MRRTRFWLLFLFAIVSSAAVMWQHATETQRQQLLTQIGIKLPKREPSSQPVSKIPVTNALPIQKIIDKVEGWQMAGFQCSPTTREITEIEPTSRIYKWVDKNGKVHFTDKAPQQQKSTDLSAEYTRKAQYFRLTVEQQGSSLPILMKDKLTTDTQKVFQIMTNSLSLADLRQVTLTIKVFDQLEQFSHYRSKVAPTLKTNSGFYNPKLNIAAVMRQRNDQHTYAVARHEATHVIIAGLFGYIPSWFTEGLAEYFEQMELSGQLATIKPNQGWLRLLARRQQQNQLMSLDQYFSFEGKNWYEQDSATMYATAWSVIYFLMDQPDTQQLLSKYMKTLSENKCQPIDAKAFFTQYYPGGLTALDQHWKIWLKEGNIALHRY